jgi:hypothetical protein
MAQIWMFDSERGTNKSEFETGKFYVDGNGIAYLCIGVDKQPDEKRKRLAVMRQFRSSPAIGSIMADISMDVAQSALYLEVTDQLQIAELRNRYEFHLKNRGRLVRPEEIGVQMASGIEGAYTTSILKRRIITK